jgi:hypothetical protein
MRDDLHKKAPIPRKAQKVLKLALREADRNYPERLRSAACDALKEFVQKNFSTGALKSFADEQGDFFGWMSSSQSYSPAEAEFLANQRGGAKPQAALEAALKAAIESFVRESRATLIAERAADIPTVVVAFSSALKEGAVEVARAICAGSAVSDASKPISLDENLLAPAGRVIK